MDASDLQIGGELGALVASHDWSRTPLGPIESWPQSLRIALRILLGSRYAMWLGWGPELTFFYNDAYRRMTLGVKHPWALGRPASEVWAEIWSDIGPRAIAVLRTGVATWDEGLLLFLERSGFREETYHTFSYSPISDDSGAVSGMLCVVTEDTERIIGERRLRTLRELASDLAATKTVDEVSAAAGRQLSTNARDLPFTLIYLLDEDGKHARLAASSGVEAGAAVAPATLEIGSPGPWPASAAVARGNLVVIEDLATRFASLPTGAWDRAPSRAVLAPIAQQGQDRLAGFLIAGLNPYRPFDASYHGFVELVAGQIAAGISNGRAYEQERRRADALAELDRAKTAFFSNVSHELRTPLTLIMGPVADMLGRADGLVPQEDRSQLALVHRSAQRLLRLVNNLLDFSRIEAGRVQASYEPTDLATVTADLASVFRSAVERARMRLTIACDALPEPVYVDRDMWEKIVLNLVSNAFKYTFEGEIHVRLAAREKDIELSVRDTGTGIPASEVPRIWTRFHRVEGARGRTHEGSGIGLALVHELVKLHGGTVAVATEHGKGSTFTVTVPRGKSHLPPERIVASGPPASAADATSAFFEEAMRWLPDDGSAAPLPGPAAEIGPRSPPLDGERPRILIADDNADMRDYLRRLLSDRHDVISVADGAAALDAARAERPDLVLTDVMMPRLDGFALLQALRADARTAVIPVIILSARAGEEARLEGIRSGADDYLTKPFSARELVARVGGTLALARARREALRREEELRAETTSVLESITEGFFALDRDYRITSMNAEAERIIGTPRAAVLGKDHWQVFPEALGTRVETEYRRAMQERVPAKFENFYEPFGRWFEIDVYPGRENGLAIYFRDITERKRRTEQLQAVVAAAVAVGGVLSVGDILQKVTDRAREIAGAREAVAALSDGPRAQRVTARSVEPGADASSDPVLDADLNDAANQPSRSADGLRLFAPILGRDGARVGVLRLTGKPGREFTAADEAILAQMAQTASVTLANARLYQAAENARTEAEAANRMKDQFLATLSHELRTPLNAILGWSHILQSGRADASGMRDGLQAIERNSRIQAKLIEDLLDLSRIISGKLRLDVQRVNLIEVIEAAIAAIRPAAEAKEIRIHSVLDSLAAPVSGDPARLQQVIWNLLSNAVKFTPRGGRIQIVLERVNSHVEIVVSDTGVGIPPDFLPYVFDRFRQADGSTTRRHGGLGLGLSIARQLVEMHGGTVRAKSPGEGKGATFSLALPIAAARHHGEDEAPLAPEPREPAPIARLDGVKVLVVDDEPDARELVSRILTDSRALVTTAGSVADALSALDGFTPDVLVSDIGMPEQDGYELIRLLRERGVNGRAMPAVALTAYARGEDRRRMLLAGFQIHVPKPVEPDELVAVVATLVGRTGGARS